MGCSTPINPKEEPAITVWQDLGPGFSRALMTEVHQNHQYQAHVFRLNTKTTQWKLSHSQEPKRIESWALDLEADLVVNGGFFDEFLNPTGLFRTEDTTISDARYTAPTVGTIHIDQGALSLVDNDRVPSTGSVLQSYPLLVRPDGAIAVESDTEKIARRTIVGQDLANHFTYIVIFDGTPLSLYTASILVPRMLPNLNWALNLDGGPSTGIVYQNGQTQEHLLPAIELPIVLSAKTGVPALPNDQ